MPDNYERIAAKATVTFTITVESRGHWGAQATAEEIMRMGGSETIKQIDDALAASTLKYEHTKPPEVGLITWKVRP